MSAPNFVPVAVLSRPMTQEAEFIRAIMSSEETYEDPSVDGLFMLFEDVEHGAEEFFVLERVSDVSGQTYAQTMRCRGDNTCSCDTSHEGESWTVECREGGPDEHWGAQVSTMREAHAVLAKWAFGKTPNGQDVPKTKWSKITF